jgi:predicted transcriptional regulator
MAWKPKVFQTNYNTIGACLEDEDSGVHIYLKSVHELGIVHKEQGRGFSTCRGAFMSECSGCKNRLLREANKVACSLNLHTNEVEVF